MSKQRSKRGAGGVQHVGRVTVSECRTRGSGKNCGPVNRVTLWDSKGRTKDYCTCTCGRRYRTNDPDAPGHLVEPLGPWSRTEQGATADWPGERLLPADAQLPLAAVGVVPLGTPALHQETQTVGEITDDVKALAKHLIKVMHRAPGVGLAANQVGMPVRMFAQLHKKAAPEVLIDPVVRAVSSTWAYNEGCLSLEVDGTHADLVRPKRIQVRARTVHGDTVEVTADEILGRIFQHEIDHLDGFMYLQRLANPVRDEVYERAEAAGLDTSVVPPAPLD